MKIDDAGGDEEMTALDERKQEPRKKKREQDFPIGLDLRFGHRNGEGFGQIVETFSKTVTVRTHDHREFIRVNKSAERLRRLGSPNNEAVPPPSPVNEAVPSSRS